MGTNLKEVSNFDPEADCDRIYGLSNFENNTKTAVLIKDGHVGRVGPMSIFNRVKGVFLGENLLIKIKQ
ncbi:1629_t:CDS:2 [Racocetra fulgida]|uniref:1629_t:CDS:1 n=1 Tax=Racocetra fulgida TaxID=60492 RepID=A0A9N8ZNN6_9GLOM|nr:1629_t:CDS:2 [Racocetra fulgida]